jgi:hypothetical protein
LVIVALLGSAQHCHAAYVATGEIRGNDCSGFIIQVCEVRVVEAVQGDDGRLYTLRREFATVDEYNESKRKCWIKTKSTRIDLVSLAANALAAPTFYSKDASGKYEKLKVDYIVFDCVRR